jgi:hypothetical protein
MERKINIGDRVMLNKEVKQELVLKYRLSRGISGISPFDVNDEFTVKYFDGSNISVISDNNSEYSFNHTRFKLKEKLN